MQKEQGERSKARKIGTYSRNRKGDTVARTQWRERPR